MPKRYKDVNVADELIVTFHGEHRPLETYTQVLADAGFAIERLTEPTNPDPAIAWNRIPLFLDVLAVRGTRGRLTRARLRVSRVRGLAVRAPAPVYG